MLAVEVDGWETRKTFGAFQSDTDRQNAITLGRLEVIRFTWNDVVRRPGVRRRPDRARRSRFPGRNPGDDRAQVPERYASSPHNRTALRRDAQK